ncbi:MAG: outer membrane protein transport protein [Alphaproteobacteria bacterium]|nr:outer membrane protein transport protein [Alphaproteobacteria bacterium]
MLLALLAGPAAATVPDIVGLGARWQGAGGGGVAVVEDGTAALLNPAGLSRVRRPTASVGYLYGWPRFEATPELWWDTNRDGLVDENDPPLAFDANPPQMGGVQASASRNVGGKFGVGFTAYVPTANLVRFRMFEPSLPNWIMYDNRPQRFVAAAGLGGQILPGLSIGASVDLLARARIRVAATLDAEIDASSTGTGTTETLSDVVTEIVVDVHEIDLAVVPALSPVLGVQLDVGQILPAIDGLVLGASYHHPLGLPLDVDLDVQANADVGGVGDLEPWVGAVVAQAGLSLFDHYQPRRVQMGLAYRRANALTVYADTRWTDWRGLVLNVARLETASLTSPFLDLNDTIVDGNSYDLVLRSTWAFRMGGDLSLPRFPLKGRARYLQLSFRGGFGYEPTPLVSQSAASAFLDTDRTMYTLGAGVEHWDPFDLVDGAVRFDIFFQYHVLARAQLPRSTDVPLAGYPVSAAGIPAGGSMPVIGGQWSFEY